MSVLPKEHGAYGQLAFPLIAAFGAAGVSTPGVLLAAMFVAGFLAHEPAAVLLGLRGPRAGRELRTRAIRWLVSWIAVGAAAGVAAVLTMDPAVRWSIAVPLVPALLVAAATATGREKTWHGEVSASVVFAAMAVPVAMAAGAAIELAAAVAIPFALLFVASTLAVRVVILQVRGGGDPRATTATRRAALVLAGGGAAALAALAAARVLPVSVLAAAAPGLAIAAVIAARPPAPAHLRTLGWTLVAVSVVTAVLVVATA